jgi:hypothetical protein
MERSRRLEPWGGIGLVWVESRTSEDPSTGVQFPSAPRGRLAAMGDKHYAIITVPIGATDDEQGRFEARLRERFCNVWRPIPALWLLYEKDFDNMSAELEMDDHVEALAGIFVNSTEIVVSWDHATLSAQRAIEGTPRGRAWFIPGKRDRAPREAQVVSMTPEEFEAFSKRHGITWEEA